MRILIFGAGAVGGYIGAHLALNGHEVTFLGREKLLLAHRDHGLRLQLADAGQHILPNTRVVTSVEQAFDSPGAFDWIAFTMKAYDTAEAIRELQSCMGTFPPIVSFQNGLGNEYLLSTVFGADKIVAGTLTSPVTITDTGVFVEEKRRGIALASDSVSSGIVIESFAGSDLPLEIIPDAKSLKWSKLLLNLLGNATSAILDMPPIEIFRQSALFAIEMAALRETLEIIEAQNIDIINLPGAPAKTLANSVRYLPDWLLKPLLTQKVGKGRGEKLPSLLLALRSHHRRTEVAWLNGAVVQAAENMKRYAPVNHSLALILSDIAAGRVPWDMYRKNPANLITSVNMVTPPW